MPAKPAWFSRINDIIRDVRELPRPFVDRTTLEGLLGVGRRRAQQVLAPLITDRVGCSGLVDRDALIEHLRHLAEGDDAYYERNRRRKVAESLSRLNREWLERPQLLVEAPPQILAQEFANLPTGVSLDAGRITVEFDSPQQALEKLLALAMAISNDFDGFERSTRRA